MKTSLATIQLDPREVSLCGLAITILLENWDNEMVKEKIDPRLDDEIKADLLQQMKDFETKLNRFIFLIESNEN